ncbi:MAG: hypothetical protein L0Z55_07425 [Planctomycetes bacterium]|nr:hypothetical protein [Planctomycetota bacterium]
MRRRSIQVFVLGAASLLACAFGCVKKDSPAAGGANAPPINAALSAADVNAYFVIPNLDRLIEHIVAAAQEFEPGSGGAAEWKADLGMLLGGVDLSLVAVDRPIAGFVFAPRAQPQEESGGGMAPDLALIMPARDAKELEASLAESCEHYRVEDGLGFVGTTAPALERALALGSAYRDVIAAHPWRHDLHVQLNVDGLHAAYGAMVGGALHGFGQMVKQQVLHAPQPPAQAELTGAIIEMELRGLLGIFNQLRSADFGMTIGREHWQGEYDVKAKPGTVLADLMATPPQNRNAPRDAISPGATMSYYLRFDPAAWARAWRVLIEEAKGVPELQTIASDVDRICEEWIGIYTGEYLGSFGLGVDSPSELRGAYSVSNEAAAVSLMDSMTALLAPESAIGKMYAAMGMPLTMRVDKDVRKLEGTAVHRMTSEYGSLASLPEVQRKMIEKFPKIFEFSVRNGWFLTASEPAALDAMVVGAGSPRGDAMGGLASAKAFGSDLDLYLDFHFAGFLGWVSSWVSAAVGAEIGTLMGPGEPAVWGARIADGGMRGQARVPLRPFIDFKKAVEASQAAARERWREREEGKPVPAVGK